MKFDARITYGLLLALFLQAAGAFVWAGKASARLEDVETRVAETRDASERLARLEEQMAQARAALARIERKLDRD